MITTPHLTLSSLAASDVGSYVPGGRDLRPYRETTASHRSLRGVKEEGAVWLMDDP